MAYFHGIKTTETPSGLLPAAQIESGLVFAVGTAPIHLATKKIPANKPILCYNYSEFVEQLGSSSDFEKYTLSEVAYSQWQLFNVAPTVFVNVLDPAKHYTEFTELKYGASNNPVTLTGDIFLESVKVSSKKIEKQSLIKDTDYTATITTTTQGDVTTIDIIIGATLPSDEVEISYANGGNNFSIEKKVSDLPFDLPVNSTDVNVKAIVEIVNEFVLNQDYTADFNSKNEVEINILSPGKIFNDTIEVNYRQVAPEKVTAADIIGGYDVQTGKNTGLECIEDVFPRFRLTPGIIIAPKFSTDVTVAAIMKAKCQNINSVFNCVAICDIPTDEIKNYTDAAEYKNSKNLIDKNLIVCYPKISLGGVQYHLSTQLASLMNQVDTESGGGIPYISPSNHRLQMDSCCLEDGTEIFYSLDQANYLNGNGIVTALNFANGWTAWGNRDSIYPSSTDPSENFIPIRRMGLFLRNQVILTFWSKVDGPINRRLIESISDSYQLYLNGLAARGALLPGARIEFRSSDNPTTDLISGVVKFKVYDSPAPPAEAIIFDFEFDPSVFESLFE